VKALKLVHGGCIHQLQPPPSPPPSPPPYLLKLENRAGELKNARTEDMNGFQQEGFGAMDMTVTYLGMVGMVGIGLRMLRVSYPPVLGEALKA